jgi:glycosyltransferase involved in cell wall biosynthesis
MKLAIVTTHPIQYNAPLFRALAQQPGLTVQVFYTWSQTKGGTQFDPKFGRQISWDIPLLDGYSHVFVENTAKAPGSHHFSGIVNPTLNRDIESWQPGAILVFGWSFRSHLACMRYFKGRVPVLFRGDSTLLDEQPGWKSMARRLALRWVYRHIDKALYTGEANKTYFQACGLKPDQLVFAPHAVDNARFGEQDALREAEASQRREALGIGHKEFVVLFAGKLEPKKDPQIILRLAARIKMPGIRFLVVGNGPLEASLKSGAVGNPGIVFMDFQNQQAMPVVYRMGNVFLLPSRYNETWGLAVNEAMASGRSAIVSSRAGCAADLIRDGDTGWTFTPGAAGEEQVATIIESLSADPHRVAEMSSQARAFVQHYAYENIARAICEAVGVPQTGILAHA